MRRAVGGAAGARVRVLAESIPAQEAGLAVQPMFNKGARLLRGAQGADGAARARPPPQRPPPRRRHDLVRQPVPGLQDAVQGPRDRHAGDARNSAHFGAIRRNSGAILRNYSDHPLPSDGQPVRQRRHLLRSARDARRRGGLVGRAQPPDRALHLPPGVGKGCRTRAGRRRRTLRTPTSRRTSTTSSRRP